MMDDMISRQAAIEAVQNRHMMLSKEKVLLINDIKKLPSAQPTFDAMDTQYNLPIGTDLISRQQAIDALENTKTAISENGERYIAKQNAIMRIDALPSAQPKLLQPWEVLAAQAVLPQTKRGKWIKTARWGRVYYCDQCRNYLDFDGVNAGRGSTNFCPNCGCRMDGGE